GIWGMLSVAPGVQAQEPSARSVPASSGSQAGDGSETIEQLSARLRKMEEANRNLAAELNRTSKEHEVQMQQLLNKFEEVSRKLPHEKGGAADVSKPEIPGNAPSNPIGPSDVESADEPGSPIPDYWSFETQPGPASSRYRISNIANPRRIPM